MSTKRRFITFQSLETGATVDRESDGLRISHQAKLSYGWLSFFFLFSAVVLFSLFRTIGQQRVVKETPRQQQSCARLPGRRCCDSRCCRLTTSKRFNLKKKRGQVSRRGYKKMDWLSSAITADILPSDWTANTAMMVQLFYATAALLLLWVLHYFLFRPLNRIRV